MDSLDYQDQIEQSASYEQQVEVSTVGLSFG